MTPAEAAEFLRSRDQFLILTHLRPDGDTTGCAAGLCRALRQAGKAAYVLFNPETTTLFTPYLEGLLAPEGFEPGTVVSVDIAARSLFPENARVYLDRVDLAIDHHPSQEFFARKTCLDAGRAACGELVYDIARALGPVTPEQAVALYVAIATDCGCFAYGNTTAATHRTAAALIDAGIPLAILNKFHFRTKSFRRLKLESKIIDGMELFEEGTVAVAAVTLEMMASLGATSRDTEDIANLVGQLEGVKTGVTLREMEGGRCKLSVRTDPTDLDAGRVCALLGGGGHAAAAGAAVEGSVEQVKAAVLAAIRQVKGR
ncbi:MAG: phosphoesterase RecJ domain-containing protein [Lawsonibacter sp.]|nr:phosphoesterase RecJ domain-containing protein [Lawsonibacter sp.]